MIYMTRRSGSDDAGRPDRRPARRQAGTGGLPSQARASNSLFVAGFIGSPKMNFLTGKFAEAEGCATLARGPEHIDVVPNGPWSGEVLHVEDLGSDHYLFVEIGSDEPVIVRLPDLHPARSPPRSLHAQAASTAGHGGYIR